MSKRFTTREGWLTFYSLACGYIEVNEGWKDRRVAAMSLVNAELNLFEVIGYTEGRVTASEKAVGLAEARKIYKRFLRERNATRAINRE